MDLIFMVEMDGNLGTDFFCSRKCFHNIWGFNHGVEARVGLRVITHEEFAEMGYKSCDCFSCDQSIWKEQNDGYQS